MHRFKWWSCMLLTQYSKHLILMSQYSVPTLITDLLNNKNKGKKARDIWWRHQSFLLAENRSMVTFNLSLCQKGRENYKIDIHFSTPETQPLTADLQSLYDSTFNWTHTCRSPSKTPFYLPISIRTVKWYETQNASITWVPPSLLCPSFKTTVPSSGRNGELQLCVDGCFISRMWEGWGGGRGGITPLNVHDALCLTCFVIFQRWLFSDIFFFFFFYRIFYVIQVSPFFFLRMRKGGGGKV